jgi:S-adenosylmethionine hydrolase
LRGDKVQLETTRADYLSITRIEVYTATLSGGAMNKNIMKNVRYDKFNNYCVNAKGEDIQETPIKGKDNLNSCLAACAMNHLKCSAAEYYAKGRDGNKCYHVQ